MSKKVSDKDTEKKETKAQEAGKKASRRSKKEPVKNKEKESTSARPVRRAESLPDPEEFEDTHYGLGREIGVIAAFAICLLIFLSNFGLCGALGAFLRGVMLGIFGVMGYLAPVILFIGILLSGFDRENPHAGIKFAACVMALIALCVVIQLFLGFDSAASSWDYYVSKSGGGLIGGIIGKTLRQMIGTVGAMLLQIVVLIVCGVCITEKSFVNFVRDSGEHAVEQAREDMRYRRESGEERRRNRNTPVRGINLASTELREASLSHAMDPGEKQEIPKDGKERKPTTIREYGKIPVTPDDGLEVPDIGEGIPSLRREGVDPSPHAVGVPIDVKVGSTDEIRQHEADAEEKEAARREKIRRKISDAEAKRQREAASAVRPEKKEDGVSSRTEPSAEDVRANEFHGEIHFAGEKKAETAEKREEASSRAAETENVSAEDARETGAEDAPEIFHSGKRGQDMDLSEIYVRNDDTLTMEELTGAREKEDFEDETEDFKASDVRVTSTAPESARTPMTIVSGSPITVEPPKEENTESGEDLADTFRGSIGPEETTPEEDAMYQQAEEPDYEDVPLPSELGQTASSRGQASSHGQAPVETATGKILSTEPGAGQDLLRRKAAEQRYEAEKTENQEDEDASIEEEIREKQEQPKKEYVFPSYDLLTPDPGRSADFDDTVYRNTAIKLQQTLKNFGVGVTVTNISCGPTVTRYELQPDMGVKVSRILALQDDIKLNLAASDIRIEAPIPGKAAIGIEVPNKEPSTVYLRELLESPEFRNHKSKLAFAVGKDIAGQTVVADIAKMPHLLIAGATGSGKSVCINTLIMSIIYKAKPDEVQLMMIDPKVVELSGYNGIPHLIYPVVTDAKKAAGALNWAVNEMDKRYRTFAKYSVRDIKGYNARVDSIADLPMEDKPKKMPQLVIIIDELADLMMVAQSDVEDSICRLAQLARAAGIHLVIATQRPSVNIITGVIKANIPSRIAFSVASGVDSRTIIDMNGAEKLIGKGDMLFYPSGYSKPKRVQGAFVSDEEVSDVVRFLTEEGLSQNYNAEIDTAVNTVSPAAGGSSERDAYFEQAGRFIIEKDKATIGMLQRAFKIGFNRAARIMDQLAEAGVVSGDEGTKARQVLMNMEQFENMIDQGE